MHIRKSIPADTDAISIPAIDCIVEYTAPQFISRSRLMSLTYNCMADMAFNHFANR